MSSSKKCACKGTLRQVFVCLRPPHQNSYIGHLDRFSYDPIPTPPHAVYVYCIHIYSILIHTGGWGELTREKGNSSQS